eukprot:SAG22_NODE_2931_length_2096_cov_1.806710_6_plen_100_part_01
MQLFDRAGSPPAGCRASQRSSFLGAVTTHVCSSRSKKAAVRGAYAEHTRGVHGGGARRTGRICARSGVGQADDPRAAAAGNASKPESMLDRDDYLPNALF